MSERNQIDTHDFARIIINWYSDHGRMFPWREENRSVYEILIAEMLLQKTQASKVASVYDKFLEYYPSFDSILDSPSSKLQSLLKPLGLYERKTKWFIEIAQIVKNNWGGDLVRSREEYQELPGVGQYVSGAIQVFAFHKRCLFLDVNIARIIGRFYGLDHTKDLRRNSAILSKLDELVPKSKIKEFYWGMLDFASGICTSRNPNHECCPLEKHCMETTTLRNQ